MPFLALLPPRSDAFLKLLPEPGAALWSRPGRCSVSIGVLQSEWLSSPGKARQDRWLHLSSPSKPCLSCVRSTPGSQPAEGSGSCGVQGPPPQQGIFPVTSAWVSGPQTDPAEPPALHSQAGSPITQGGQPRPRESSHAALGAWPGSW